MVFFLQGAETLCSFIHLNTFLWLINSNLDLNVQGQYLCLATWFFTCRVLKLYAAPWLFCAALSYRGMKVTQ